MVTASSTTMLELWPSATAPFSPSHLKLDLRGRSVLLQGDKNAVKQAKYTQQVLDPAVGAEVIKADNLKSTRARLGCG